MNDLLAAAVLEHAVLPVRSGQREAFERALEQALPLVAGIQAGSAAARVSTEPREP